MKGVEKLLVVRPAVAKALAEGRAVVGLETTIVTHGLPRPANVEAARSCEAIVRENGAVPATIGILDGRLVVGIEDAELGALGNAVNVTKTNLSNLAVTLAAGGYGATSVSTTVYAARLAGIDVVVTGGIGGVHRDFSVFPDISSDLTALQHHAGIVVCAGAKSILDVAATREQLETRGIPVLGWQTDWFPLFYSVGKDIPVDVRMEDAAHVVTGFLTHKAMQFDSGILVVVEPPAEDALPYEVVERALEVALSEIREHQIIGRDVTPFLLSRLKELTQGESLKANLSLIRNNCRVGSQIAVELARRRLPV